MAYVLPHADSLLQCQQRSKTWLMYVHGISPEEYEIALIVEGDDPPPSVCWILHVEQHMQSQHVPAPLPYGQAGHSYSMPVFCLHP